MKADNKNRAAGTLNQEQNTQPKSVQNDAPGYGDKKLEGPNRPST
jgi:hypothetical protein